MSRTAHRPAARFERKLAPLRTACPECGRYMRMDYLNYRRVITMGGAVRLTLKIRRCHSPICPRFYRPFRPEAEGRLVLPRHEFGLDVVATIGALRHGEHRT